jgi:hypothetical protein
MLLYKFGARGSRVALTQDKTGSNLPEDGRPWKLLGLTRVDASDGPRIGAVSLSFRRANAQRDEQTGMWDGTPIGERKSRMP